MKWTLTSAGMLVTALLVAGNSLALIDMVGAAAATLQEGSAAGLQVGSEGVAAGQAFAAGQAASSEAYLAETAAPVQCLPGLADVSASNVIFLKTSAESLALSAINGAVDNAASAVTQVTLGPLSGPLNPAFGPGMTWVGLALLAGSGHTAFEAAQSQADGTFTALSC